MIVIGCSKSKSLAKKVAEKLNSEYYNLEVKKFPDGELYIKFNCDIKNKEVILVQTLHEPNESLLEIILAGYTAKDLGAKSVTLVAPYLAYMRQDKRFNPGEAISSKIVGKLFKVFDKLITIDPHLHRHKNLNEVFSIKTEKLTANSLIEDYISKNYKNPVIIGPDEESYQWAQHIAKNIKASAAILKKERFSSKKVKVKVTSDINIKDKDIVIIDDIISTGQTILKTVNLIKKQNPKSITIIAVHGIFADLKVYKKLKKYKLISTNTIENKHSVIDVSKLIANSFDKKV